MKKLFISIFIIFIAAALCLSCGDGDGDGDDNKNPLDNGGDNGGGGYTVSGRVVDSSGNGIANVTVGLTSETAQKTATTNDSGNYSFSNCTNGAYMVIPADMNYTFNPEFITVNVSGKNVAVANFVGQAVNGGGGNGGGTSDTINITVGDGLQPQISWTGGNVDAIIVMDTKQWGDNYAWYIESKSGTVNAIASPVTYGVTPSGAEQEAYSPLSAGREYRVTISRFSQNGSIVGYAYFSTEGESSGDGGYTVKGSVVDDNREALPGAAVVMTSDDGTSVVGTQVSDRSGNYTFTGVPNGSYIITVAHENYTFREPMQQITVNGEDEIVSNFRGQKNQ